MLRVSSQIHSMRRWEVLPMEDIKPGDVVQLKSGGPRMTVNFITDGKAYCQWLADEEPKQEMYQLAMLLKVQDEVSN